MSRKTEFTIMVDNYAGIKIHELRVASGMSRQQLASLIEVTHQQLQKYERGTNRISAGRLALIAHALKKPISYFFNENGGAQISMPSLHARMGIEVARNFLKIKNSNHQNAINILVKTLAENN